MIYDRSRFGGSFIVNKSLHFWKSTLNYTHNFLRLRDILALKGRVLCQRKKNLFQKTFMMMAIFRNWPSQGCMITEPLPESTRPRKDGPEVTGMITTKSSHRFTMELAQHSDVLESLFSFIETGTGICDRGCPQYKNRITKCAITWSSSSSSILFGYPAFLNCNSTVLMMCLELCDYSFNFLS